jgi:hypothetical protein
MVLMKTPLRRRRKRGSGAGGSMTQRLVAYVSNARRASARTYRCAGGSVICQRSAPAGMEEASTGAMRQPRITASTNIALSFAMVTRLNPWELWGFGPHKFRAGQRASLTGRHRASEPQAAPLPSGTRSACSHASFIAIMRSVTPAHRRRRDPCVRLYFRPTVLYLQEGTQCFSDVGGSSEPRLPYSFPRSPVPRSARSTRLPQRQTRRSKPPKPTLSRRNPPQ